MKKDLHTCNMSKAIKGNASGKSVSTLTKMAKNARRIILSVFCIGLMMGTTSCCKSVGCGTWSKIKQKPSKQQYACYKGHY